IRQADETARAAGVNGRIDFRKESIHDLSGGSFDVVLCIETLHEMAKPNPALIRIRERASGGTLIVIEQDSVNPQLLAATNFLYCLPVSIAAGGGALGALAPEAALRELLADAGFSEIDRIPTSSPYVVLRATA